MTKPAAGHLAANSVVAHLQELGRLGDGEGAQLVRRRPRGRRLLQLVLVKAGGQRDGVQLFGRGRDRAGDDADDVVGVDRRGADQERGVRSSWCSQRSMMAPTEGGGPDASGRPLVICWVTVISPLREGDLPCCGRGPIPTAALFSVRYR